MSEVTEVDVVEEEPTYGSSPMDLIRKRHQELVEDDSITLPIEPYDGMLHVKYKMLDIQHDVAAINARVTKESKNPIQQAFLGALDTMSRACVEIFFNRAAPGEEPDLVPLSENFGPDEPPVRYDIRLGEFLGLSGDQLEKMKVRGVILHLFGGKEPLVLAHSRQLTGWFTGQSEEAAETLEGEM
jgi:hypothetical protein